MLRSDERRRSRRWSRVGLLILIATLSLPGVGHAESLYERFTVDQWLIGVGGAIGISNFDEDDGDVTGSPTLRIGHRPILQFAWEVETDYFVKFEDSNARPLLVTANGRWMIPRHWMIPSDLDPDGRWQPFLLGGGGWMQVRQSKNGNFEREDSGVFRVGAGIEFYSSINVSWRLDGQYLIPVGDGDDFPFGAAFITVQFY